MFQFRLQEKYVLWRYQIDSDLNINTKLLKKEKEKRNKEGFWQ